MDKASDILAKVGGVLYLPLAYVLGQVSDLVGKLFNAGDPPGWLIISLQVGLGILIGWVLISKARKNRAERQYWEKKNRDGGKEHQ